MWVSNIDGISDVGFSSVYNPFNPNLLMVLLALQELHGVRASNYSGAKEGAPLLPIGRFRHLRALSLSGHQAPGQERLLEHMLRSLPQSLERLSCGRPATVRVSAKAVGSYHTP